jgi:hypothetical protein
MPRRVSGRRRRPRHLGHLPVAAWAIICPEEREEPWEIRPLIQYRGALVLTRRSEEIDVEPAPRLHARLRVVPPLKEGASGR